MGLLARLSASRLVTVAACVSTWDFGVKARRNLEAPHMTTCSRTRLRKMAPLTRLRFVLVCTWLSCPYFHFKCFLRNFTVPTALIR